MLTKCLSIAYDRDASCPTWDTFLWRIMGGSQGSDDPDTMSALQQFPPMAPIFYVTMMSEQSADDLTSI